MASTALHEMGYRPDVIERQLAHTEKNAVRAAYHRSQYLEERRTMMQQWADFLDAQRGEYPRLSPSRLHAPARANRQGVSRALTALQFIIVQKSPIQTDQ
jgi:hypothetical protein